MKQRGRQSGAGGVVRALLLIAMAAPGASALAQAPSAEPRPAPLLDQAREAARADRNAQAARLFARHLRERPGERRALLREYADQLIYSGRPEAALPLLAEHLARADLDPAERRAAEHSRALALLWSDQHRAAIAAYDRLLLADRPDDERALAGRARALQWLGRPDRALAALPPGSAAGEAADIRREIGRDARPLTRAAARFTDQADGLEILALRIEQNLPLSSGALVLRPDYERLRYRQGGGRRLDVDAPGLAVQARAGDALQLAGRLGLEAQDGPATDRTVAVYEASLGWKPSDDLRFDVAASRRTLDNLTSLERGITTRNLFASADYWPSPLLRLTVRGEFSEHSDGNERRWFQGEVEHRLSRRPNMFIGARASGFSFSRQLDNGYFNPRSWRSAEITARGWSKIGRRSWVDLAAAAGPEHSTPGGTKLAYWLRGRFSHQLDDRLELSLAAERFSSQGHSNSGFSRNILSLGLGYRWR